MTRKFQSTRKFDKEYKSLDTANQKQVIKCMKLFMSNPSHPSLRLKRVQGAEEYFELSASMSIRVIVHIDSSGIDQVNTFFVLGKHEEAFPAR